VPCRPCTDKQDPLQSRESKTAFCLQFRNESKSWLQIVWIDFDGNLKKYEEIEPEQVVVRPTYFTHPFCVFTHETRAGGHCIGIFLVEASKEDIPSSRASAGGPLRAQWWRELVGAVTPTPNNLPRKAIITQEMVNVAKARKEPVSCNLKLLSSAREALDPRQTSV
jgi:hypothetical protein